MLSANILGVTFLSSESMYYIYLDIMKSITLGFDILLNIFG